MSSMHEIHGVPGVKRKQWQHDAMRGGAAAKPSMNGPRDREGTPGSSGGSKRRKTANGEGGGGGSGKKSGSTAVYSELSGLGNKTISQAIGLYEYLKRHRVKTSLLEIENNAKLGNPYFVFSEDIYNYLITLEGIVESSSKNGAIRFLQYVPLIDLSTPSKLQAYIRAHSTKKGVPLRTIREEYLGDTTKTLEEWEKQGKILIMRAPGNMPLPDPGGKAKKNVMMKGSDAAAPGMMEAGSRNWRTVFWDFSREIGDAPVGKLDPELTQMWADIKIDWDADIEKLLASIGHEISAQELAKKTTKKKPIKKKKPVARALNKLTNTHLLKHGIDLSQDYVPE